MGAAQRRPRPRRITGRHVFAALRAQAIRHRVGLVTVTRVAADPPGSVSVAFAVPRQVGGAVARNRIRRRLRQAFHEVDASPGSYLIAARAEAAEASWAVLRHDLEAAVAASGSTR